ncbi:hypothetical protein [Galactobacter caseinivorans]|uniref:hypothetical protein n=1 Tax=Galactobacter caseinivorans TaxID=2676123 RepID=UPI0011C416D7|nr:hypothetical protein [Galactobacter caseinivorans]
MRSFPARPLAVGECVDSVNLPVLAEAEPGSGVMRRRQAVVRPEWALDGVRLRDMVGEPGWVFVGEGVWEEAVLDPLESSVVTDGAWVDEDWRLRAYQTLLGRSPGQARWFPLGLVPLLGPGGEEPGPAVADPGQGSYLAVRVVPDGAGVRWSELRRVDLVSGSGRDGSWSPELGPNLLAASVPWTREELSAELLRAAQHRASALPTGVPGVPHVPDAQARDRSWVRAWDSDAYRLHRTARRNREDPTMRWQQPQRDAFQAECAAADPLRLGVGGQLVDRHSYEGCRADLEELLPFSAIMTGGTALLRDYFEQVWGFEPDAAGLRQVMQRLELVPRQLESWDEAPVDADDASQGGREGWGGRMRRWLRRPQRREGKN